MSWLALFLACGSVPDRAPGGPSAAAVRTRGFSVGLSPVTDGADVTIRVAPVDPGERVVVAWSFQGEGEGPCPVDLAGCFGLEAGTVLGDAPVDLGGVARLEVPPPPPGVTTVHVQAAVVDAAGTVHLSRVVARPVLDAASVFVGDLVLHDRADLAPARAWVAVDGDLVVEGTDLEELELPALAHVGGDLRLWENDVLEWVDLPALEVVDGDLSLYDDPVLDTVAGLGAVHTVGGTLALQRLDALEAVQLPSLVHAGSLYLYADPALASVAGLEALTTVVGPVRLWELTALERLALPSLAFVQGRLDLFRADALTALALPALVEVGSLEVHACDALPSLDGLEGLAVVSNDVLLHYDASLASVEGLAGLTTVGALTLEALPVLSGLELPSLEAVDEALRVETTGVEALGLWGLLAAGEVEVRGNPALTELGLESLAEVATVRVRSNGELSQCAVERWVDELPVAPDVRCGGNLDDGCLDVCEAAP